MVSTERGASALFVFPVAKNMTPAGSGITPDEAHSTTSSYIINSLVSLIGCDSGNTLLPSTFIGGVILPAPAGGPVTYYLMRWIDPDCNFTTYRTWTITGTPDPTGIHYSGAKCGSTAISNAVVAATWQD